MLILNISKYSVAARSKERMKSANGLLRVMAITAILILIPSAIGGSDKTVSLDYDQHEALAGPPSQMVDPLPAYPSSEEQDDYATNQAGDVSVISHTTRVAPWMSSPMSGPVGNAPIHNFGVVEEDIIYRSAQPTDAEFRWLLNQGFKSIVSFRRESGDTGKSALNMGFKNYLWLSIEDETNPNDEQAKRFLDFVTDPQNWPVLIYCKVGAGRTGTMSALIRYAIDGWSMEEAIEEARLYRNGVSLVENQLDWLNHWAANHPPACHRPAPPLSE